MYFLTRRWKFVLDFDETQVTPEKLEAYALSIHIKNNCPLKTCWGFVDGTIQGIARPVRR